MLFKPAASIEPIYSGGPVAAVSNVLATALAEKVVVSDITTGEKLGTIESDGEPVTAMAITPDRSLICISTRSLQLYFFSLETFKKVKMVPKTHEAPIVSMAIDATSTLLATGGVEGAVKVWDIKGGFLTHNFRGHGGIISALRFYGHQGGGDWRLASGSEDGKIRVWDLVKSKSIAVLDNHVNAVRGLAFSPQGDVILSAGRDKVVSLWKDNKLMATLPVLEEVEAAGFLSNKFIYTGTPQGVLLWSLGGKKLAEWKVPHEEALVIDVIDTGDSEKGWKLLASLSDQTLADLGVRETEEDLSIEILRCIAGNFGEVIDLASTTLTDKESVFALATNSQDVRVVNRSAPLEFVPLLGHTDIVIAIDVLANWLVSGGKDKTARLWDLNTAECKIVFEGHAGSIGAVALSKGSSTPKFVLTGSQDLTVKKWGPDGAAEYTRKAHDKDINALDVSADNKLFATGSQDRTAKVWDTETGEVRGVLRGHRRGVWSVKFGPDHTLLTGSGDKTIRLWNLHDFTALRTFEGHMSSVLKVAFLNQELIASAGGDGLVKIWEIKTTENIATLDNHEDKVWSITVTKDGQLVSGGGDGVITVWEDYTEEEKARKEQEEENQIEIRQELENSVRHEEWEKALSIALELNHPFRLLKLFEEVAMKDEASSITGLIAVDQVLAGLEGEKLSKLLTRVRDWNTNARTSHTAQTILVAILKSHSISDLSKPAIIEQVSSIIPYSQRHLARLRELEEASYSIDFALGEMALAP